MSYKVDYEGIQTDARIFPDGDIDGSSNQRSDGHATISIIAEGGIKSYSNIFSRHYLVPSDARKKNIIGLTDNEKDLEILKKVRITDYVLKDPMMRHHHITKKVIAQEVEKIYPTAVNKGYDYLPDVFQFTKKVSIDSKKNTVTIEIDSIVGLKKGDQVKIEFGEVGNKENTHKVRKTNVLKVEGKALTVSLPKELKNKKWNAFVYGRYLDDVRSVDYDAISMLNVSATQVLAKEIETLKAITSNIEEEKEFMKMTMYALVGVVVLFGFMLLKNRYA